MSMPICIYISISICIYILRASAREPNSQGPGFVALVGHINNSWITPDR